MRGRLRTHSTSPLSGLLFIGTGLLFLLTEGTAGSIAPTTVDQQTAVQYLVGRVPGAAVLFVVVLIALVVMGYWLRYWLLRRRGTPARDGEREREEVR